MNKETLIQELNDVIETSKTIRNYMTNKNININDRLRELPTFNQALGSNKNIVSAVSLIMKMENLTNGTK